MITKLFKGKPIYFKGLYSLYNEDSNMATPVDCPTIFTAFGQAIRSGNWQSCTALNTAQYIFDNYIEQKPKDVRYNNLTDEESLLLTELIFSIDNLNNWVDIDKVKPFINIANELIIKIGWK